VLSVVRIDRVLDVIDRNARDITRVLPAIFGDADKQDDSWACRGATLASFCNWAGRPVRAKCIAECMAAPRGRRIARQ
jgi:hypothetical protein